MEKSIAVKAIRELIECEAQVMKGFRTAHGPSKKAVYEERRADVKIFAALTGEKPSEEELKEMVEF